MSGRTIGAVVGTVIGGIVGGPAGARWGFTIGSTLGGIVKPDQIKGPKLEDASRPTAAEGVPIPWGYGTYPVAGHLIWAGDVQEHEKKEGGKGGPQQVSYTYTRAYAIAFGAGEATGISALTRNGKLVYDIRPGSTILGQNAKFLAGCTIYLGSETQLVDPTIEAAEGVGATSPYRGTIYIVLEDDTTQAGEVAQWEAVVQKCGTVTDLTSTTIRFVAVGAGGKIATSFNGMSYTLQTSGTVTDLYGVADGNGVYVAAGHLSGTPVILSSTDAVTWTSRTSAYTGNLVGMAFGQGVFVIVGNNGGVSDGGIQTSTDGTTWTLRTTPAGAGPLTSVAYGNGVFVAVAGNGDGDAIVSADGISWTKYTAAGVGLEAITFANGLFMTVGNFGTTVTSPDGQTWTYRSAPLGSNTFISVAGNAGTWVAGTNSAGGADGIYYSTDDGVTWTRSLIGGSHHSVAYGGALFVVGSSANGYTSPDGITWTAQTILGVGTAAYGLDYVGPDPAWYTVPDAPGVYADEDGVVITDFVVGTQISACGTTAGAIVADLCDRSGIDSSEYDVSELTDFVKGFKCAAGSSADGYIGALANACFFDRGEWDKKVRFIKRGGASVGSLTMDDLVRRDGPAIEWTEVNESELLRKVSVLTLNPDTNMTVGKQTWERRVSTIQAKGESTLELPLVASPDTTAQIAAIKGKIAWTETAKGAFGLSLKHSKYTPTDVLTLTDDDGEAHRIRFTSGYEENNIFTVEEATRDRAEAYESNAVGTVTTQPGVSTPGLIGHTLFAAMALPMLRSSDNSPGFYVGACGILGGWTGCTVLMSVDGGLSYQTALTITEPTIMGNLTAACTTSSEPIAVRVFGTLSSATFLQVGLGKNWAAISAVGGTAEIIAYETATSTGTRTYDLTDTYRGRDETVAAAHVAGEQFMDLATAYFLPIPQAYAGGDILFKAVALGVSQDAVDPVTVPFEGTTYVYDGGEVTP